ncbi:hypothetical protein [Spirosoma rhododendri]|uniref:Uncharacterized protein n=1 Tax=Spirosoma rhododendri TaxID=2728024 RepID=A0A7L5DM25_9BACT|nr:hypothetical protein [Spirosoma rhododendri]QJD79524.1 hypothetical protein HH216_14730 [Spirosoma rhododendri]
MNRDFHFRIGAAVSCSVANDQVNLEHVDVMYKHSDAPDDWKDRNGHFTEKGVDMLLFGFTAALIGVIHATGHQRGADTAALMRQAISLMEQQFVMQVSTTNVHSPR